MDENIKRLILSSNKEDILIGLGLLKAQSISIYDVFQRITDMKDDTLAWEKINIYMLGWEYLDDIPYKTE